jgi:hypothetical protein
MQSIHGYSVKRVLLCISFNYRCIMEKLQRAFTPLGVTFDSRGKNAMLGYQFYEGLQISWRIHAYLHRRRNGGIRVPFHFRDALSQNGALVVVLDWDSFKYRMMFHCGIYVAYFRGDYMLGFSRFSINSIDRKVNV